MCTGYNIELRSLIGSRVKIDGEPNDEFIVEGCFLNPNAWSAPRVILRSVKGGRIRIEPITQLFEVPL